MKFRLPQHLLLKVLKDFDFHQIIETFKFMNMGPDRERIFKAPIAGYADSSDMYG